MNKIAKILAMLTMVSLAACAPENEETIIERDVFYTVANNEAFSGLSGKTIHLRTESEWEALLDRFCDYVKDGNQVLTPGTEYSVSYKDNMNVGTATVTVTGQGEYSGTTTKTFIIKPKPLTEDMVFLSSSS